MNLHIKRYISVGLSVLLVGLFLLVNTAFAVTNYSTGQDVILPKSETINSDYFAAGNNVLLDGTVNGDAYVAGGNVTINGIINGDLLAAGGNINVIGKVAGNIRAAGGQINVSGTVGRNMTAAGGTITLQTPATVSGSLTSAGGNISVLAPIRKGLTIAGGQANIDTTIGGNITGAIGQLSLMPNASVAGNLEYWSNEKAHLDPNTKIAGQTFYHQTQWNKQKTQDFAAGLNIGWMIFSFMTSFVIGMLFIKFLPVYTQDIVQTILTRPWISLGIGFLATILFPIAFIILLVTIVGIPVAFILLAAGFIFFVLNETFIGITIGEKILPHRRVVALILGLVIYEIISLIPIINWIGGMVAFFIGLGAFVLVEKQLYMSLRTRKVI